jgi:hypothetical protein
MATYSSSNYTNKTPVADHGLGGEVQVAYALVTCTAAPTTTDTINFFYLPANARILAAVLKASDMDTGGSPSITLNIGDSGSAARLFSASTAAQAGTVDSTLAAGGRFYKTTAKTLITGVAQANAATGAAGTLELMIEYVVENSATS